MSSSPNPLNLLVEEAVEELSFCFVTQVSVEPPATECHHHPSPVQPLHPGPAADAHGRCSGNGVGSVSPPSAGGASSSLRLLQSVRGNELWVFLAEPLGLVLCAFPRGEGCVVLAHHCGALKPRACSGSPWKLRNLSFLEVLVAQSAFPVLQQPECLLLFCT